MPGRWFRERNRGYMLPNGGKTGFREQNGGLVLLGEGRRRREEGGRATGAGSVVGGDGLEAVAVVGLAGFVEDGAEADGLAVRLDLFEAGGPAVRLQVVVLRDAEALGCFLARHGLSGILEIGLCGLFQHFVQVLGGLPARHRQVVQQVVAAVARGGAGHLALVFRDEAEGGQRIMQ